jgi:hypothetical protein
MANPEPPPIINAEKKTRTSGEGCKRFSRLVRRSLSEGIFAPKDGSILGGGVVAVIEWGLNKVNWCNMSADENLGGSC